MTFHSRKKDISHIRNAFGSVQFLSDIDFTFVFSSPHAYINPNIFILFAKMKA